MQYGIYGASYFESKFVISSVRSTGVIPYVRAANAAKPGSGPHRASGGEGGGSGGGRRKFVSVDGKAALANFVFLRVFVSYLII